MLKVTDADYLELSLNAGDEPFRAMITGVPGVGKTTLAANAPAPAFLDFEDGLGRLPVPTFGRLTNFQQTMTALEKLFTAPHAYETLVLDTVDALEALVWAETCRRGGWDSIAQPAYGRGYVDALLVWREIVAGLEALRSERGMAVILIAHTEIRRYDSPETEGYDRYAPKLQARASALLREWCDAVLFCNYRVATVKDSKGTTRGVGSGERVIYTTERPAFLAKNRYGMPDTLPMTWEAITEFLPQARRGRRA
jgi:AAA domain